MTATTDPTPDLVCAPGAIAPGERAAHFALAYRLFAHLADERVHLPSGIALRLPADNLTEVARFVANERKCCPFLHIEVELGGGGPIWLRLTGPEGTRELIDAELGSRSLTGADAIDTIRSHDMSKTSPGRPTEALGTFKWAATGALVGAFSIAACCLLPLVLLNLGFGGAWMGSLAVLTPFKPLFIVGTATLLGYGYYQAYFAPKMACADSSTCETPGTTRWMKRILWGATALALAGSSLEYVEPYLIG